MSDVFVMHVFQKFPDLGLRLFNYFHTSAKAQTQHLGAIAFRQQCERFLGILDDMVILENYVKMFCEPVVSEGNDVESMTPEGMKALLMTCFQLAMAHYTDGAHAYCPLVSFKSPASYDEVMNFLSDFQNLNSSDDVVLLFERIFKRWIRMSLVGTKLSPTCATCTSFLFAHTNYGIP